MKKRVHLNIYGRVQGVLFRDSTRRKAKKEGVFGYAKNLSDGSVEVIAEGEEEKLINLIEYCKRGPLLAKVSQVEVEWEENRDQFSNFKIEYV